MEMFTRSLAIEEKLWVRGPARATVVAKCSCAGAPAASWRGNTETISSSAGVCPTSSPSLLFPKGPGNRHSGDTLHNMGLLEALRGNAKEARRYYGLSIDALRKHVVRIAIVLHPGWKANSAPLSQQRRHCCSSAPIGGGPLITQHFSLRRPAHVQAEDHPSIQRALNGLAKLGGAAGNGK